MNKTRYENQKQIAVETATVKAAQKPSRESTWTFRYRNQDVATTVRLNGKNSTQHVRNKGK